MTVLVCFLSHFVNQVKTEAIPLSRKSIGILKKETIKTQKKNKSHVTAATVSWFSEKKAWNKVLFQSRMIIFILAHFTRDFHHISHYNYCIWKCYSTFWIVCRPLRAVVCFDSFDYRLRCLGDFWLFGDFVPGCVVSSHWAQSNWPPDERRLATLLKL